VSHAGRASALRPVVAALAAGLVMIGCADLHVPGLGQIVSVLMTPDTVVLRVGDTALVRAAPLDATASLLADRAPAWTSSLGAVVIVNDTGRVIAVGPGTATITATVGGVVGTAVAVVTGQPATVATQAGAGQMAAVNTTVSVPPAVRVTDAGGNPVPRAAVTFAVASGGGSVSPSGPVLTDFDGVAAASSWTLGPSAGANTLTAAAAGSGISGNPATFTATATVGPPHPGQSSIAASPTTIAPSSGASFATITVTVRDSAGSTIAGATVVLAATGNGNVLIQPTGTTDNQGRATGALSSSVAESKTVSATVNGTVALTQTATVVVSANAPAGLGVATQPTGAVSNQAFTTQPVVEVRDAFGNPIPTATDPITVTLVGGNGALFGTTTVNAVNGRASFSGLLIRGLRPAGDTIGTGPHVMQFSALGFNAVRSDTFQVTVSHAYNILDIYARNCTGCHAFTYANSVNQPATFGPACAGQIRITPGDTTLSVIYQKVRTATPSCGGVMPPPPTGQMSPLQIRLIRDWILQGAPNN